MAKPHFDEVFQFERVTDKEIAQFEFNVVGSGDAAYLRVPTSIGIVAAYKGDWLAKGDNGWHVHHEDPRKESIPAHAGEPQPEAQAEPKARTTNQPLSAIGEQTADQPKAEAQAAPAPDAQHPTQDQGDQAVVKVEKTPKKSRTTNHPLSAIGEQTGKQP